MKLALGQFSVCEGRSDLNLSKASKISHDAAENRSDLLLLPELWINGFALDKAQSLANETDTGYFNIVQQMAVENKVAISGSMMRKTNSGQVRNSSVIFFPDGLRTGFYDKLHLFEPMLEQTYLEAGEKPLIANTKLGKIGFAICYDLRFPELFRYYALQGVKLVLLSAQWPMPRIEHWKTLLKARAIENQMFIAACNRVGNNRSYEFFGNSTIIGPSGEVILEMGHETGVGIAEIDISEVDEVREKMKVLNDYRGELFE